MKSLFFSFIVCFSFTLYSNFTTAQTLIMNEVSNGPAGNQEYVEFVVVDTSVSYNCNSTTPPCIDIRGWIFDDNSGYHGSGGVAAGAVRFSNNSLWSCIPLGTIILIYNDADPNPSIPANDLSMSDGNCTVIAPINNTTLFERNSTTPGAVACSYPGSGWVAGGTWTNTLLANSGDCARIVNLAGCEVFSVCWATNNLNNMIYFNSGGSGSQNVWYFNNGDPEVQSNWTEGSTSPSGGAQTPGWANNTANAAYINQFNNGCLPITPLLVTATSTNAGCTCTGTATATASGSIPGYTYQWVNSTYTPIGQNTATATGLCAGTYYVIATSGIGCLDTASVTITSTGSTSVSVNNASICNGASTTLTATPTVAGGTFLWSPGGQTTNAITIAPTTTTSYTVTYTLSGCSGNGTGTVTVNPLPNVVASPDVTICAGTTTTLTASGASNYSWSPATYLSSNAGSSVVFTAGATTSYTVSGTSAAGCVNTDVVQVTVAPLPVINAGADQTACAGSSITITALGIASFSWDNGVTSGVPFNPAVGSTVYTLTGTSAAGCTITDQVTVTILPNPTPVIAGQTSYCAGNTASLSTTNAYSTYAWSNGSTNSTATVTIADNPITVTVTDAMGCSAVSSPVNVTENPTINTTNTIHVCQGQSATIHGVTQTTGGNYTQTFTATSGCDSISNVNLILDPLPLVNAGVDQTACAGSSITLSASGSASFSWDNGVSDGVPFNPAVGSIVYTLSGTSASGCAATDQVSVTILPNPAPVIAGQTTYCTGNTASLSTTNAYSTYAWSNGSTNSTAAVTIADNPITVTVTDAMGCSAVSSPINVTENPIVTTTNTIHVCQGQSVIIHGVTQTTGGNYTQTFTAASGCDSISSVNLILDPLPAVNAGNDQTICNNQFITLSATGAVSYTWDHGALNNTPFLQAAGSITYTVTGTSAQGCTASDQVTVVANPVPVAIAGNDLTICAGGQITLTGSGAQSYNWDQGVINGTPFSPAVSTTYTLTATDANGCSSTDQVSVTVNPAPVVSAGSDQFTCLGNTVTLSGSGATTYLWDNGITNGVPFTPVLGTNTYTLTGTTANGCSATDQVMVTVTTGIPVTFTADLTNGCAPLTVQLTNTTSGATNCTWNISDGSMFTGCGSISTTFTQAGCYDVTLTTSVGGCTSTVTLADLICVDANPQASFIISNDELSELNMLAEFINTSVGASTYLWDFGDSTTSTTENPQHDYTGNPIANYTVMLIATSDLGCVDTAYQTIQLTEELIFYVPNAFTPDGDEYNNLFKPVFYSGFDPYDFSLLVFDRWGEIIFESNDATIGWDGSYGANDTNNGIAQNGTYTWKIEFKSSVTDERKIVLGHVNLLR
jgi:gliding motility-associated-like protein